MEMAKRSSWWNFLGLALVLGFGCVGSDETPEAPTDSTEVVAAPIPRRLHVLALGSGGSNGFLLHRLREGTTWSGIGDVYGQTGSLGALDGVAATMWNNDLHVVVHQRSSHHVFHAIRFANGSWTGFSDVHQAVGDIGAVGNIALATGTDGVHLFVTDAAGSHLNHTVRFPSGSWASWIDLTTKRTFSKPIGRIAASFRSNAIFSPAALHLLFANSPAKPTPPRRLFHTLFFQSGSLDPIVDVSAATGASNLDFSFGLAASGDLQVVPMTSSGPSVGLSHAIRSGNGQWTPLGDVKAAAGGTGLGPFPRAPSIQLDDGLHVFASTPSGTFEAVRLPSGAWVPFRNELPDMRNGSRIVSALAGTPEIAVVR
jgi:hypothetical protein